MLAGEADREARLLTERPRRAMGGYQSGSASRPNFDSGFGKAVSDQQLMRPRLAFSIAGDELRLRGGQPATVSRMLGGRALPVALNRGPMVPVAGVRRVMR